MTTAAPQNRDTASSSTESIRIEGARTHNLKNIDVEIPHDKLVVITGPSGSGKSSLAFDTIFSEGQRQYVESLSIHSRQFFHQLPRADVDLIEGLQPTLCLDQQPSSNNPRSTVGTVTEVYDYLRVLMARAGDISCFECGNPIRQQTTQQIRDTLLALPENTKMMLLSPIVRGKAGAHADVIQKVRRERLVRLRIDGEVHDIDRIPSIDPKKKHTIDAVTDRIIVREGIESRLMEALDLSARLSGGLVTVVYIQPDDMPRLDEDGNQVLGTGVWHEKLFSTLYACSECGINYAEVQPRTFSFNSPYGACTSCTGIGFTVQFDDELTVKRELSVSKGAVLAWAGLTSAQRKKKALLLNPILDEVGITADDPLSMVPADKWDLFLNCEDPINLGLHVLLAKELATATKEERQDELHELQSQLKCQACDGSRLQPHSNSIFVGGKSIGQIVEMSIDDAAMFFSEVEFDVERQPISEPLLKEIRHRLAFLQKVGVGYLTLARSADTLSGGEYQRIRLATSIGSGLTNVCYVLDEPSIGLHQRDNDRLIAAITDLREAGNTIVVVEHDEAMMRAADHLIDMGPGAGTGGGMIVAEGDPAVVMENDESLTGDYLSGRKAIKVPSERRQPQKDHWISIKGASGFNLKSVDVEIPLGVLNCITGVSGSGKSTLINQTLAPAIKRQLGLVSVLPSPFSTIEGVDRIDKLVHIDQRPIGRTPRGCAATFTGAMAELRKIYAATKMAKSRGYTASRFSFNSKAGWCPDCQGHGVQKITMNFLPNMFVECDVCSGRRYNLQTLQVKFRDLSIADVLAMPAADARREFENISKIHDLLASMCDVGLGYLPLGQATTTFSGGEAQRLKLATELAVKNTGKTLYLLDEPTTGLHFEDIQALLVVLNRLVDKGNTVILIEHNLDVIKSADWLIDLGPDGGVGGGELMASGTPEDVAKIDASFTGRFLKEVLGS